MNDEDEAEYLQKLTAILKDCLTGERKKHAMLVVANDDSQTIAMYSVNANDLFVDALLAAARTHLEIEDVLGSERTRH